MSVTNTDSNAQRERVSQAPPLQPDQSRDTHGEIAARRSDSRPLFANAPRLSTSTATVLEVGHQLQQQSYEWTTAVRLLEQSEHALNCAEMDRHLAYDELARVIPNVMETSKQLSAAVDASRPGHPLSNLKELFLANSKALEQLESVSATLSNHFLRYRTAWDQYSRSVENAQRLRGEITAK
jgi:hypothetical protein